MLTKREKEVLDPAAKGSPKNAIAAKLFVSHHKIALLANSPEIN